MKFSYVRFGMFYKPVLPVNFKFKDKNIIYQVLIDTGADIAIIHSEIAQQLGIDLSKCDMHTFGGIGGKCSGYLARIDLEIGGTRFENIPIIFSNEISQFGFGILGHQELFDRIKLSFEFNKKQFEIIPKNYK